VPTGEVVAFLLVGADKRKEVCCLLPVGASETGCGCIVVNWC
jgi:hypothetical protein